MPDLEKTIYLPLRASESLYQLVPRIFKQFDGRCLLYHGDRGVTIAPCAG